MVPDTYIKLEGQQATQMIRLMEALEDNEDVQNVHANFDIDTGRRRWRKLPDNFPQQFFRTIFPLTRFHRPSLQAARAWAAFAVTWNTFGCDAILIPGIGAEVFNTFVEKFVEKPELTLVTFCQPVASTVCTVGGANRIAASPILSHSGTWLPDIIPGR